MSRGNDIAGGLTIDLPKITLDWLKRLSRVTGDPPEAIIASMLEMIRTDDEAQGTLH